MHAVIKTGGKQYRVEPGDELEVEKLSVDEGSDVVFEEVLAVGSGANLQLGSPFLEGASVTANVLEHGRSKKVIVFKKKRRKGYAVKRGHRQPFTRIRIMDVSA